MKKIILIAFSFFTLLYQFVESKKTITRLMVLREKITNLLTLEIGLNERVLHIEKLYTLVNLYVNLFANSNVDDEDDLLFYMFANEISINLASARKFVTNNEDTTHVPFVSCHPIKHHDKTNRYK